MLEKSKNGPLSHTPVFVPFYIQLSNLQMTRNITRSITCGEIEKSRKNRLVFEAWKNVAENKISFEFIMKLISCKNYPLSLCLHVWRTLEVFFLRILLQSIFVLWIIQWLANYWISRLHFLPVFTDFLDIVPINIFFSLFYFYFCCFWQKWKKNYKFIEIEKIVGVRWADKRSLTFNCSRILIHDVTKYFIFLDRWRKIIFRLLVIELNHFC